MINFPLIKLVNPTWYYNLNLPDGCLRYWTDYRKLSDEKKSVIDFCNSYDSDGMTLIDASYQIWHKGFIDRENSKSIDSSISLAPTLNDQYKFIRRMYKPIWTFYILIIRLITFNNPINEIRSYIHTSDIKMVNLTDRNYIYKDYETFDSMLIKSFPKISIVIPTLDRYRYLKDALHDLERQTYKNIEVIIVDQSQPYKKSFYDLFDLDIIIIRQEDKKLWLARNRAIAIAKGDYILLYDDDSRVESDWVEQHIKCIDFFKVDISAGVSISKVGAPVAKYYCYFRWSDQLDTGNVLLHKNVFIRSGLFDRQFEGMRMGDGEFGARALLNGFSIISNPKASRVHLKVDSGGLRKMGSWDGMRPTNIFGPRPIPSVLYFYRKYWGDTAAKISVIKSIPLSLCPYKFKGRGLGYLISLILFTVFFPIVLFQVIVSWIISSKKLKEGAIIEKY